MNTYRKTSALDRARGLTGEGIRTRHPVPASRTLTKWPGANRRAPAARGGGWRGLWE